jgi:hypothetical protein
MLSEYIFGAGAVLFNSLRNNELNDTEFLWDTFTTSPSFCVSRH